MRPAFVLAAMPLVATSILLRDVTKPEFQDFLKQNKLVLTAFSSPDYEPVQPFVKIFEHVAHTMQTPSILINCDKEKELCKDYDINSYPAIRMLSRSDDPDDPQSHIMRYRGKRTEQALKSFVLKHELPAVTHIRPQGYQHFKEIDDVVVIAYIHPDRKDQKALLSVFEAVAAKHRHEFVFGYVDDLGITSAETVNLPSVTCWRNIDGDDRVFNGPFTEADLDALLVSAKTGVIGEFSERNMHLYMAVSSSRILSCLFGSLTILTERQIDGIYLRAQPHRHLYRATP
jgi:protein disulfide-isomerase A1